MLIVEEPTYDRDRKLAGILSSLERVLLEPEVIHGRVREIAAEIERDFAGTELNVVTLLDGALFFVADLVRSIQHLPIRLHTMSVSSYHGNTTSSGRLNMAETLPFALGGRDVLLIDDILDTGLTLATVQARLLEEGQPASLRTAVLLRKERPREPDVPVDYVGFDIADEFVVGYGMDYRGHYRNLPCIGILNPDKIA